MKTLILMLIAVLVGGLIPLQGVFNSQMGKQLHHPMLGTFVSFTGAMVVLFIVLACMRPPMPSLDQLRGIPWYYYTGGLYGVIFVTMVLMLAPKIGIANTLVAALVGQLIVSVAFDHFAAFGLTRHPVNWVRIAGCFGLLASIFMIQKR